MMEIAIAGNYAFAADYTQGMSVIDISDPTSPFLVTTYPGAGNDIEIDGNLAYFADDDRGLVILAVSDPTTPTLLGTVDVGGAAMGLSVIGDIAYVASWGNGLVLADVSNPSSPEVIDAFGSIGARNVEVKGIHALLCDQVHGTRVVKTADAAGLDVVGSAPTEGSAVSVLTENEYAFVSAWSALEIFDISDPSSPALAAQYSPPDVTSIRQVLIDGEFAFMDLSYGGWYILDISDPIAPSVVFGDENLSPTCMAVRGDYAYLMSGTWLRIYDLTGPANPTITGATAAVGQPTDIALPGHLAYIADLDNGLVIYDIGDPSNIVSVGSLYLPDLYDVEVEGRYAYLCDTNGQIIHVVDISFPSSPV